MSEKRVKAWAVVDKRGNLSTWDGNYTVIRYKKDVENIVILDGERVVRVTVRVEE